jgi:hypothetical protein
VIIREPQDYLGDWNGNKWLKENRRTIENWSVAAAPRNREGHWESTSNLIESQEENRASWGSHGEPKGDPVPWLEKEKPIFFILFPIKPSAHIFGHQTTITYLPNKFGTNSSSSISTKETRRHLCRFKKLPPARPWVFLMGEDRMIIQMDFNGEGSRW